MLAMAAGPGAITDASPVSGAGEEEGKYVKPFTPEKAKELIMSLQQPAVFCNMVFDWPAQHWTAKHLSEVLQGKQIRFRMGMKSTGTAPQFETTCSYIEATLEEFLTWNCDQSTTSEPFRDYDHSKFWAYADYKYFVSLFEDKTDIFQAECRRGDNGERLTQQLPGTSDHFCLQRRPGNVAF